MSVYRKGRPLGDHSVALEPKRRARGRRRLPLARLESQS